MDSEGLLDFRHAPVTKFLVPVVGGCSALIAALDNKPQLALQLNHLTVNGQFWRLFITHWAFSGISTTVVGTWLIYKMRIVERRYGSAKYMALVFISFVASTILQSSSLAIGSKFGLKSIASGPFAILFTILYQYQNIVPPSYSVSMVGTNISDKTYVFISAAQLLFSNSTSSIVPCLCGIVAGAMYETSESLKQWRFPKWARSFANNYILPVLATNNKKPAGAVQPMAATSSRSPSIGSSTTRHRQAPPPPPIKEEDINTMLSMFPNYSRQDIRNALVQSKSDLNRAAEILLTTEPSTGSSASTQ